MKRLARQDLIKSLISQTDITTQEELKKALESRQIIVTQATLSRDIRELGLVKLPDKFGRRRYVLPNSLPESFVPEVFNLILSVSRAEFMVVIKTELGNADVLANLIDADNKSDILGTVAGADTLLIICKDKDVAAGYETALASK